MLNNRISRGKRAPLIFQACREVAPKGIFKTSLMVGVLMNTETIFKKKETYQYSTDLIEYLSDLIQEFLSIRKIFTCLAMEVKHLSNHNYNVYENIQNTG